MFADYLQVSRIVTTVSDSVYLLVMYIRFTPYAALTFSVHVNNIVNKTSRYNELDFYV